MVDPILKTNSVSQTPKRQIRDSLIRYDWVTVFLAIMVIVITSGVWAVYLLEYGVDVPRYDQLQTPSKQIAAAARGELDFSLLIQQHNESRKLWPNLISVSMYKLRGFWDVRLELLIAWIIKVGCVAGIALLSWFTTRRLATTAVITAFYSGLLWSSHTMFFHLFSVTLERSLPQLLLVLILVSFLHFGLRWSTVAFASFASSVAQFSYASGIVIWPLVLSFILFSQPRAITRNFPKIIFFGISAALSCWLYFDDYVSPGHDTAMSEILNSSPSDMLLYLLHFTGNGFTKKGNRAAVFGALVLGAYLFLGVRLVFFQMREHHWKERLAWVIVGGYSLAQALLSMIGRLPMGIGHALRLDYVSHPLYIITSVLALGALTTKPPAKKRIELIGLGCALVLTWTSLKPGLREDMIEQRSELLHAQSCWILSNFSEQPDCLLPIYWDRADRAKSLGETSPLLKRPILESLAFGEESDPIEVIWDKDGDFDIAKGSARINGEPADAVVALSHRHGQHEIISIHRVGFKLADLAGFSVKLDPSLTTEPCSARLYAMRNDTGRLHRIRNSRWPRCDAMFGNPL